MFGGNGDSAHVMVAAIRSFQMIRQDRKLEHCS